MNFALFRAMLKSHGQSMFSYGIGSVLYQWLLIWVYPSIAQSSAMNDVLKQMPESLQRAFGFQGGIQQLSDYLASEYYGLLFLIILMAYSIITSIQLVGRLVDQGSMAYLLATPVSRTKIALTQAGVLLCGLLVIAICNTVGGVIGVHLLVDHPAFDVTQFVLINVVGFLLFAVIGGYSFLFSCLFNDEKRAVSVAATLTVVFFALDLIGKLSKDLAWLKHITVFTAFQPTQIARGTYEVWPTALGLGGAAIVLFAISVVTFRKRDLPL
ncbi:MAG: ABC transporter permease subunit [Tumebacillaceae bacterium]